MLAKVAAGGAARDEALAWSRGRIDVPAEEATPQGAVPLDRRKEHQARKDARVLALIEAQARAHVERVLSVRDRDLH